MRFRVIAAVLYCAVSGLPTFAQVGAQPARPDPYDVVSPAALKVDVPSLIRVRTSADVARVRTDLIQFIWKNDGRLPNAFQVERAKTDLPKSLGACPATCERITVTMAMGFKSVVYHVCPTKPTRKLAIFHQGHDGDVWSGGAAETVTWLVDRGYSVMAMQMPLFGDNKPSAPMGLASHNDMARLVSADLEPIKFFLEPVAAVIESFARPMNIDDVVMIGLSGGGWTTTLYAALDPRVRLSFPVAGTLPDYLRAGRPGDTGDWEQYYPALYKRANYLDLYVLGSSGKGRHQRQVLNKFDSCCFWGVGYRTYEPHVRKTVADIGPGYFDVYLDESHRSHRVSANALQNAIGPLLGSPRQ